MRRLRAFCGSESGAVTVDWVVLTAAVVGLGLLVIYQIGGATENVGSGVGDLLANTTVGYQGSSD